MAVDGSAESALIEAAKVEGLRGLRARARAVKAAIEEDRLGRYEWQRLAACFRHGVDQADGMVWGQFRLPPDDGAAVINRIEEETDRVSARRTVPDAATRSSATRRKRWCESRPGRRLLRHVPTLESWSW
jgi:hypothetical protein